MKKSISKIIMIIMIINVLLTSSLAVDTGSFGATIQPKRLPSGFSDVQADAWYYNDVMTVVDNGIMTGKSGGQFDPNGNITNAEIAQILKNLQVPEAYDKCPDFTDVPAGAWYTSNAKAYGAYFPFHYDRYLDVVEFWPDFPIDRSDLAYTLLQAFGYDEDYMDIAYMELTGNNIMGWKRYPLAALEILASKGVISGYSNGELGDSDAVSRAQCAAIINRMVQAFGNVTDN